MTQAKVKQDRFSTCFKAAVKNLSRLKVRRAPWSCGLMFHVLVVVVVVKSFILLSTWHFHNSEYNDT